MSGGYFDYQQYKLEQIADKIKYLIDTNEEEYGRFYSKRTIEKFKATETLLRLCAITVNRIDWLVSGDDGEDTFHKRLKEDLYDSNC